MRIASFFRIGLCMILMSTLPVHAQDVLKTQGRKVLSRYRESVFPVEIVSKIRMNMEGRSLEPQERTTMALATVIDPAGLLILSNTAVNPESIYKSFFGQNGKLELSSEVSSITIHRDDGTEVEAEVLLRDKDLDIAIIRVKKDSVESKKLSWKSVDLVQGTILQPLDDIYVLERVGRSMNWKPAIRVDRIKAVIKRPRLLYIPSSTMLQGQLGTPVFTRNGECAGILLLKLTTMQRTGGMDMDFILTGFQLSGLTKVILPSKYILQALKEAKSPEKH